MLAVNTRACVHASARMRAHTHTHTHIHTPHMHTRTRIHAYTHTHAQANAHTHAAINHTSPASFFARVLLPCLQATLHVPAGQAEQCLFDARIAHSSTLPRAPPLHGQEEPNVISADWVLSAEHNEQLNTEVCEAAMAVACNGIGQKETGQAAVFLVAGQLSLRTAVALPDLLPRC